MTNRKIIIGKHESNDYKGIKGLLELLKIRHKRNKIFAKLIELVKEQKMFDKPFLTAIGSDSHLFALTKGEKECRKRLCWNTLSAMA